MTLATAHAPTVATTGPDVIPQQLYRMSLETYERIAELGVIPREAHVVLLDGILVQTMTKGPDHSLSSLLGQDLLRSSCPPGWHVRIEQPITLPNDRGGDSAPEPDLSVVIGTLLRYAKRHPGGGEVGLIVEVASSVDALAADRKGLERYAFAGIPTVWIVTLYDRKVHVHTEPSGPTPAPVYARVEIRQVGELIEASLPPAGADQPPAVLGPVAVASFFPPAP